MSNTVLDDISFVIGFTATQRLAVWYGDTNLYVPTFMADDHALVGLIGAASYGALVRNFGGKLLWIPMGGVEGDRTQKRIAELLVLGNNPGQIADLLGMSPRRIRQVIDLLRDRGLLALMAKRQGETARQNRGAKPGGQNRPEKTPMETQDGVFSAANQPQAGLGPPARVNALDELGILWRGSRR